MVLPAGSRVIGVGQRMVGQVGMRQIGRAADQLGQRLGQLAKRVLAGLAAGDRGAFGGGGGNELGGGRREVVRQVAPDPAQEFGGQFRIGRAISLEPMLPVGLERLALARRRPIRRPPRAEQRRARCGQSDRLARARHFLGPERRAVGVLMALLGGRAAADHGLAADQARPLGLGDGLGERGIDRRRAMAVDRAHHVPAIGFETLGRVVGEPLGDLAVDGNAVVVVERDQLAEPEPAGERSRLVADALHQAAVADDHKRAMIDDGMAGPVELRGKRLFGDRHADRVGEALAERPGGGLDAEGDAEFRMPRRLGMKLAEALELLDRQLIAGEMQQRVEQRRGVAVRQHEAVAVGPGRVGRIVAQIAPPQHAGDFGEPQRRAGMAGFGVLHHVHRQRTHRGGDRVG